jgi:hypothetical protein
MPVQIILIAAIPEGVILEEVMAATVILEDDRL